VSENLDQTIRAGASNEGGFFRRIAAEISVMERDCDIEERIPVKLLHSVYRIRRFRKEIE
jgi:hypothetical protein